MKSGNTLADDGGIKRHCFTTTSSVCVSVTGCGGPPCTRGRVTVTCFSLLARRSALSVSVLHVGLWQTVKVLFKDWTPSALLSDSSVLAVLLCELSISTSFPQNGQFQWDAMQGASANI